MIQVKKLLGLMVGVAAFNLFFSPDAHAALTFPVVGSSSYTDDFNSPRANGPHHATDIIANKHQPVVSATSGVITHVEYPQKGTQGYMITVRTAHDNYISYIHLNNDDKGTDNGRGGGMKAFAPDIKEGNPIKEGQLIGWVGDSGNAEGTVAHLHFEIREGGWNGKAINPYLLLRKAYHISKPIQISYPELPSEILPFTYGYNGKVNVARADVTYDGREDTIAGAEGAGSSPRVHVYDWRGSTKQMIDGFSSLSSRLRNGVDVAAGDVDGDGRNELLTAVEGKYHAKVGIYKYNQTSKEFDFVRSFVAFEDFNTTPRISSGDIDNDGKADIVVASGEGTASKIHVFDGSGTKIRSIDTVFTPRFKGGIDVAVGNVNGTWLGHEIVATPLTVGSSRTAIFNASQSNGHVVRLKEFYAHGSYKGGSRISIGELSPEGNAHEIVSVANNGSRPITRVYRYASSMTMVYDYLPLEEWWRGYYDVAASRDGSGEFAFSTGGNRRGSIR